MDKSSVRSRKSKSLLRTSLQDAFESHVDASDNTEAARTDSGLVSTFVDGTKHSRQDVFERILAAGLVSVGSNLSGYNLCTRCVHNTVTKMYRYYKVHARREYVCSR